MTEDYWKDWRKWKEKPPEDVRAKLLLPYSKGQEYGVVSIELQKRIAEIMEEYTPFLAKCIVTRDDTSNALTQLALIYQPVLATMMNQLLNNVPELRSNPAEAIAVMHQLVEHSLQGLLVANTTPIPGSKPN
jgi:hypothetical protein